MLRRMVPRELVDESGDTAPQDGESDGVGIGAIRSGSHAARPIDTLVISFPASAPSRSRRGFESTW